MIKAKKLELVGAGEESVEAAAAGRTPREVAHGHAHPSRIFPRGNRGG
jgi:hypothetical protein